MEEILLMKIEVEKIEVSAPATNSFSLFSVKTVNESHINTYIFPFNTIFFSIFSQTDPEIIFFYDSVEVSKFSIPIKELKSENSKNFDIFLSENEIFKALDKITLSVTLFNQNFETQIPESLIKKYKTDLNDTNSIKNLLIQTIESTSAEFNFENFHEIALDVQSINSTEKITKQEAEHLKELILGVNEKLKTIQLIQTISEETKQKSQKDLNSREFLQNQMKESWEKMEKVKEEQKILIQNMQNSLNNTQKSFFLSEQKNRELEKVINELNGEIKILQGTNENLEKQLKNFENMEKTIRDLQTDIKNLEKNRNDMRNDFKNLQNEYEKLINIKDEEFEKIANLNTNLEEKLEIQQSEKFFLKNDILTKESLILTLNSEVSSYTSEIKGYKDQDTKAKTMEALAKKHQQECIKSSENLQKTTGKFSEVIKTINQEKQKLLKISAENQKNIQNLTDSLKSFEEKFALESTKLKETKSQNEMLTSTINSSIDSQHISRSLLKLHSNFIKAKQKFCLDSQIFVVSLTNLAHDFLNFNRIVHDLKNVLFDKCEEIMILKDVITELQKKIPYVAAKDDPIDFVMADYVNSRGEPLEIPFVREDSGIYLFGSKRIFVKLDNGKLSSNS